MWTIYLTEWCVRVASTLLWDVCDIWFLCYLPLKVLELMEQLEYTTPLGYEDNKHEFHALLEKSWEFNWDGEHSANTYRDLRRT